MNAGKTARFSFPCYSFDTFVGLESLIFAHYRLPLEMTPRELVCARCWRNFFDTEAYEKCCTYNRLDSNHERGYVEAVATTREIRNVDCNWRAYIGALYQIRRRRKLE